MVNSNMVKFHLIRSFCEIFYYHFPNISCLKCTVNSNFHLIRSKIFPTNDFELTVPNLYKVVIFESQKSPYLHNIVCDQNPMKWVEDGSGFWAKLGFFPRSVAILGGCFFCLLFNLVFHHKHKQTTIFGNITIQILQLKVFFQMTGFFSKISCSSGMLISLCIHFNLVLHRK